jgi:integrase
VKLSECIEQYVADKRRYGTYSQLASTLRRFASHTGDPNIETITVTQVATYIEMPRTGSAGWHHKYNLLRAFFVYCNGRYGAGALPLPPKRPPPPPVFHSPYVYSKAEIRSLIRATTEAQESGKCTIGAITYRALLILLYGTGAQIRESLKLNLEDVNLRKKEITFRDGTFGRERTIPIGRDLYCELNVYINCRKHNNAASKQVFIDTKGCALSRSTVDVTFKRILRIAEICPRRGCRPPRLCDLRTAFVVHRLNAWCKSSNDMHRIAPALAAYIGQVGLTSIDRYLQLTAERFRRNLNILSPRRCPGGHWRENVKLMSFLDSL